MSFLEWFLLNMASLLLIHFCSLLGKSDCLTMSGGEHFPHVLVMITI